MEPKYRATVGKVFAVIVLTVGIVIVVGGLTEMFAGNGLAQFVRKTILLGSSMGIAGWVIASRKATPAL